ncbi:MAG: permease [Alphaproteobacteria bacterium]
MTPATLSFFVRHEGRLVWREWLWWIKGRPRGVVVGVVVASLVFALLHLVAGIIVKPLAGLADRPDVQGYVLLTGIGAMAWMLLLSQAMESVTRVLYSRGDVDLVLSSPAPARFVFALRLAIIAGAGTGLSVLMLAPFVTMLVLAGGSGWIAGYAVLVAMGASSGAVAIASTLILFRILGPRRTRLVAQIVAAIVGGAIVIGLQVAAIVGFQGLDRFSVLTAEATLQAAPALDSLVWLPVRAATGDGLALAVVLTIAFGLLGSTIVVASRGFADHVVAAAGAVRRTGHKSWVSVPFSSGGARAVLRAKELALLAHVPWLMSQCLMQILYLLPPALLLWRSFGEGADPAPLIVPVVVMAAGQLAGGFAWLAISGEDAPDLVATAPVRPGLVLWAKIEAVFIAVGLPLAPLVVGLSALSLQAGVVAALFILFAAAGSTAIQLMFRSTAKRSAFRRRQTASRLSTIAEAFSSIAWAAAAGLAAVGSFLAIGPALFALVILGVIKLFAPAPVSR